MLFDDGNQWALAQVLLVHFLLATDGKMSLEEDARDGVVRTPARSLTF